MARNNDLQDGRMFFTLPSELNYFQNTDGQCEHAIKTANPIAIEFVENGSAQADGEVDYFAYPGDREEQQPPEESKEEESKEWVKVFVKRWKERKVVGDVSHEKE